MTIVHNGALEDYLGQKVHVKRGEIEMLGNNVANPYHTKFTTMTFTDGEFYKSVVVDSALGARLDEAGAFIFKKAVGGWRLIAHDNRAANGLRTSSKAGMGIEIGIAIFSAIMLGLFAFILAFIAVWSAGFWVFVAIIAVPLVLLLRHIGSLMAVGSAVDGLKFGAMRQAQ